MERLIQTGLLCFSTIMGPLCTISKNSQKRSLASRAEIVEVDMIIIDDLNKYVVIIVKMITFARFFYLSKNL